MFKPNLRNMLFHNATCSCIIGYMAIRELYLTFAASRGFSLYHFIFAGRISEAAIGGAVDAQRPVLRVIEIKKTGARSERARTRDRNLLGIYIILHNICVSAN